MVQKVSNILGESEAFSQPRFFDYSRPLSLQTSDISHLCLAALTTIHFFNHRDGIRVIKHTISLYCGG